MSGNVSDAMKWWSYRLRDDYFQAVMLIFVIVVLSGH
jgi:hypothetical protein